MRIGRSLSLGFARVAKSPKILFWLYAVSLLIGLPLAAAIYGELDESIGHSLIHRELREGFDMDWYREFDSSHSGLCDSFGPQVVGVLPILTNFESLLDGSLLKTDRTILITGILFLLAWTLLGGGIIHRYARSDTYYSFGRLLSEGSQFFFRLARLLALSLCLYWAISLWFAEALRALLERATLDVTTETQVVFYDGLAYGLVAILLLLAGVVFDYAKISLVLGRRRSVLLAIWQGLRLVWNYPGKTLGLYLSVVLLGFVIFALYGLIAPGPSQSNVASVSLAFLTGQLYFLMRMTLKLWLLSSQISMYQSEPA